MERKSTSWIFQATNWRDYCIDDLDKSTKRKFKDSNKIFSTSRTKRHNNDQLYKSKS